MLYIKLFIEREKIQVNLRRSVPLSRKSRYHKKYLILRYLL